MVAALYIVSNIRCNLCMYQKNFKWPIKLTGMVWLGRYFLSAQNFYSPIYSQDFIGNCFDFIIGLNCNTIVASVPCLSV